MKELNERVREREIQVELTEDAVAFIAREAYEPAFGARPLKRYLQKNVETLLARKILGDEVKMGDIVTIDVIDGILQVK